MGTRHFPAPQSPETLAPSCFVLRDTSVPSERFVTNSPKRSNYALSHRVYHPLMAIPSEGSNVSRFHLSPLQFRNFLEKRGRKTELSAQLELIILLHDSKQTGSRVCRFTKLSRPVIVASGALPNAEFGFRCGLQ